MYEHRHGEDPSKPSWIYLKYLSASLAGCGCGAAWHWLWHLMNLLAKTETNTSPKPVTHRGHSFQWIEALPLSASWVFLNSIKLPALITRLLIGFHNFGGFQYWEESKTPKNIWWLLFDRSSCENVNNISKQWPISSGASTIYEIKDWADTKRTASFQLHH